jgi:hypothetical protein
MAVRALTLAALTSAAAAQYVSFGTPVALMCLPTPERPAAYLLGTNDWSAFPLFSTASFADPTLDQQRQ